jgi:hypothetical protein
MQDELRQLLRIPTDRLDEINDVITNPKSQVINNFLEVLKKYGTPEEINNKAKKARQLESLYMRIKEIKPEYIQDLQWLEEQRDRAAFISIADYQKKVLGDRASSTEFHIDYAVTLENKSAQYFPYIRAAAERAIDGGYLMPARFIRVRKMKEQEADGDLPAFAAAMQIIGASYVETLDTKGTDGSNIHLGGPETITGYFGGVRQPNSHALNWLDEYLYYYTKYGVKQVLNINSGTVILGYLLYRLGVDIEFKISVFMGNDNPYAAFWTLIGAKLFSRDDGTSPLIGFNWSNSINNQSMEISAQFRKTLGFEKVVRFEHHITETWKSIVKQPYNRREELIEIASHVPNISAKHEGGDPEIDSTREHPSDIIDYFRDKAEVIESGDWDALLLNFLDKFDATNKTAWSLTENGLTFVAAGKLH